MKATAEEYNIRNFLLLLQLAGEMYEDIDCHVSTFIFWPYFLVTCIFQDEIFPAYVGENGNLENRIKWQNDKNRLWKRLNFRLFVSIEELQKVLFPFCETLSE